MIESVHQEGIVARDLCGGKECPGRLLQVHRSTRGIPVDFNDKRVSKGSQHKAEPESFDVNSVKQHRAVAAGVDRVCSVGNGIQQIVKHWRGKLFHSTGDEPVSVKSDACGAHTDALVSRGCGNEHDILAIQGGIGRSPGNRHGGALGILRRVRRGGSNDDHRTTRRRHGGRRVGRASAACSGRWSERTAGSTRGATPVHTRVG